MQPNLFSHLELLWNLMLIMALLVLGIGILQKYHGPIVGCTKYVQLIWLLCQPLCEHGRVGLWMQGENLH